MLDPLPYYLCQVNLTASEIMRCLCYGLTRVDFRIWPLVVILFGMFLNVSVAKMGVDLKFDFTYILVTCMPAQFACFDPPPLFM